MHIVHYTVTVKDDLENMLNWGVPDAWMAYICFS